jgi:type I restriction enzyme M protein
LTLTYIELLADEEVKNDLIETLVDTLGYDIEPAYLFNVLTDQAKQNTFQLNDLNKAFIDLSTKYDQFNGLFDDVDLTSKKLGSDAQQRNITITEVIKKLNPINLLGHDGDVIGDAYEFLISQFASEAGKKAGEFYTPHEVSVMMARIAAMGQEDKKLFSVYDPTMGSGSLMLNIRNYINHPENVKYHGQELNTTTFNLAKMNLILHGVDKEDMRLSNGDTLNKDWPTDEPYTFDSVLMNPPYSAKWSSDDTFLDDSRFNRFGKLAPKSKADFAFLLHGFYHLKNSGTMAIVLPHGVLFRGAAEGVIRQKLLEDGSIDAVIGMPSNLFFGTSIPTTVIILKKNRETRDVLFIDASNDFIKGKNQNKLSKENIDKVVETYRNRENIEKYAHVASFEEIKENDFNINISRYVDTFEEKEVVDMAAIGASIKDIRKEKSELELSLYGIISSLQYEEENAEWIQGALEVFKREN